MELHQSIETAIRHLTESRNAVKEAIGERERQKMSFKRLAAVEKEINELVKVIKLCRNDHRSLRN